MPYYLNNPDFFEPLEIRTINKLNFSFSNAIVVYESIGEDGGYSINNGRLNSELSANVILTRKATELSQNAPFYFRVTQKSDLDKNLEFVRQLKELRKPVTIAGNGTKGRLFGKYLIQSIEGDIKESDESVEITINFVEYRQANVKRTNLVTTYETDSIYGFLKNFNFTV